jgi:predicted permease
MELPSGIRRLFSLGSIRRDVRSELDEELAFHLEETVAALVARGSTEAEAREEAARRFGNEAAYRRELETIDGRRARSEEGMEMMEQITSSVGFALRSIRRSPGFAAAIVLILGLGIGANAVMFGVVDRLLLSPPQHIRNADAVRHLYVQREGFQGRPEMSRTLSYPDYLDLAGVEAFEQVAAYAGPRSVTLGSGETAERIRAGSASWSLFPLLGVVPNAGRFFIPEEDALDASPVALLSQEFWERRYGADPSIVGSSLDIGSVSWEIVGILPAGFTGAELSPVDVWLPITRAQQDAMGDSEWMDGPYARYWWWLRAVVRVRDGVSDEIAHQQATAAHRGGREEMIAAGQYDADVQLVLAPVIAARGPTPAAEARVAAWLAGVSVIVLLIACFNVANLLLARAARWQREIAVRMALGISRGQLLAQLLTESLVLSTLGAVAALVVGHWGARVLHKVLLPDVAFTDAGLGSRLLLFIGVTTLLTALLAGMLPAVRATRAEVADALRGGGRGIAHASGRTRTVLLVAQAALSVLLLIGAGLFVRSLSGAQGVDLGFDAEHVLVVRPEWNGNPPDERRQQVLTEAVDRLRGLPDVSYAGLGVAIPFQTSYALDGLRVPGLDSLPSHPDGGPYANRAGPGWFEAMSLEIIAGRGFTPEEDAEDAAPAVVITESLAAALWPGESALGRCMVWETEEMPNPPCTTVVGVVENFRRQEISEPSPHFAYFLNQGHYVFRGPAEAIMVRTTGDVTASMEDVRRAVGTTSSEIRFPVVTPLMDNVEPQLRPWRLGASMFSLFGLLALVVAGVGLYSVLAFDVALRRAELGIRAALGASRSTLVGMVVRRALTLVGAGVALGAAVTLVGAPLLEPLLFGVSPRDPVVYLMVVSMLAAVAALAGWIPARRVARVDPRTALEAD